MKAGESIVFVLPVVRGGGGKVLLDDLAVGLMVNEIRIDPGTYSIKITKLPKPSSEED